MTTLRVFQHESPAEAADSYRYGPASSWNIGIEVNVDADARRIAEALTVPEYMEAWACVPGHDANGSVAVSQVFAGSQAGDYYILNYRAPGQQAVNITCSYLMRHRRKMLISWRKGEPSNEQESFVKIRIRGNFARSILLLDHGGLSNESEYRWHKEMWKMSLARLALILQPAFAIRGPRTPQVTTRYGRDRQDDTLSNSQLGSL
jgi:hypothetical protein